MKRFRKTFGLALAVVLVVLLAVPVLADSYEYSAPITVTETGGTAKTGVPVLVDLNNSALVTMDYLKVSGLDTRVQEAGTDRDYSVVDTKLGFLVPSLAAYQGRELTYYTTYNPDNADYGIVVGPNGYVIITDDDTIELGAVFEVEQKGYINTAAVGNLVCKESAFATYISGATDITSTIWASSTWTFPTGFNDPDDEWDGSAVDESDAYDNDTVTSARAGAAAGSWCSYLELTRAAMVIDSVRIYAQGNNFDLIDIDVYGLGAWYDFYQGAFADEVWETKTEALGTQFGAITKARVRFHNSDGAAPHQAQLYEFRFGVVAGTSVTATGITSGVRQVNTTAAGGNLTISVYDVDSNHLGNSPQTVGGVGAGVPLTITDYALMQNDALPYMDYMTIDVGGVEQLEYNPVTIIIGTALPDTSIAPANDGIITWGGRFADSGSVVTLTDDQLSQADDFWTGDTIKIVETTDGLAPEGEEADITDFTSTTLGGTADSGTNATIVDAELVQPTAYWAAHTVTIVTTTDGGAPQGESQVVATWDLPTSTLTFPVMTAVVDTGDTYTLTAADTLFFDALTVAPDPGDRYEIWDGQTILWGAFPDGVSVEVGALDAYVDPVSDAAGSEDPEVAETPQEPGGLWGGGADPSDPLYALFNPAAVQLGWTTDVLYVVFWISIAVGLGMALLITTGSILGAIGGVGVGMIGGMSTGMLPVWVLLVYLILAVSWLYASRSM